MSRPAENKSGALRSTLRLLMVTGSVIIADQATKVLIKLNLAVHEQIVVIKHFFNITHVLNPGGAFGFFAGQPLGIRRIVFLFLSSIVALGVLWFYKRCAREFVLLSYGLALIFGGALGNLIDRFRCGLVVDFLDFYIGSVHWPAFNVADSCITIGMGILIFHIVFNRLPEF